MNNFCITPPVKKLTDSGWTNIWLFSIYAIILATGIGLAYRVVNIDKNLEKLVTIEEKANK